MNEEGELGEEDEGEEKGSGFKGLGFRSSSKEDLGVYLGLRCIVTEASAVLPPCPTPPLAS